MDSCLAGLKNRVVGRVATILIALSVSVTFIFILIRLTPGTGMPDLVRLGGLKTPSGPAQSLQACSDRPQSAEILRRISAKYDSLQDDKFT